MSCSVKRIGVLTSGGDAPGMNAAIRATVLTAQHLGIECVGIRRGYAGLLTSDVIPLSEKSVDSITKLGGTMLYTARCPEFLTKRGQRQGATNCGFHGIDALIVIGGDGSFKGAHALYKLGVPVIGIPGTIDNDIGCTSYTIGFDTACNTAIDAVDKLNDTMQSHERCAVVEVMGRSSGHLALQVGITTGATVTLIPEVAADFEEDIAGAIRKARLSGKSRFTVIVAEGAGKASLFADRITAATGIETRLTALGHIQRGGTPQARDRFTATKMGNMAVNLLCSGEAGRVVAVGNGRFVSVPLAEALEMKKELDYEDRSMQEAIMS